MPLILAALLLGMLAAAISYATHRWAPLTVARVVLALSIVPVIGFLIYCAVALGLAIKTNDMRYFGADMVFGMTLIATLIWVPSAYVGARFGRAHREP